MTGMTLRHNLRCKRRFPVTAVGITKLPLLAAAWLVCLPPPVVALAVRTNPPPPPRHYDHLEVVDAEVVGANGRLGSLFLSPPPLQQQYFARAVPRGLLPGCLSQPGRPIYVTTPAKAWPQIYRDTLPHRREDLVWIGNGMPPTAAADAAAAAAAVNGTTSTAAATTMVVVHFGVLTVGGDPVTAPSSPPTYAYGKHAQAVRRILEPRGVAVVETPHYRDIRVAAARKLLWASSMWLLCHAANNNLAVCTNDNGRTVAQVHEEMKEELDRLVRRELFPALCAQFPDEFSLEDSNNHRGWEETSDYLTRYSYSMPGAVPNRALALSEWQERNAFFLRAARNNGICQSFHEQLLHQVGGLSLQEIALAAKGATSNDGSSRGRKVVELMGLSGLFVAGDATTEQQQQQANNIDSPTAVQSVIVVGGGILGSSVALHLARQQAGIRRVTVVDLQSPTGLGVTTPASWAWLNANGKSPQEYAWLNQLGMEGWKRDDLLAPLPTWDGALVKFRQPISTPGGGYRCQGPLDPQRLKELEPSANLIRHENDSNSEDSSWVYYFPDEGAVDPLAAVQVIREEATKLGVTFLGHLNVTGFVQRKIGERSSVAGIIVRPISTAPSNDRSCDDNDSPPQEMRADIVVLAAGVGATGLAGIPMLYRPGQVAFAKPATESSTLTSDDITNQRQLKKSLQRILVDTVQESHVLQRRDGTFVAGGGILEVGGDGATLSAGGSARPTLITSAHSPVAVALLERAQSLVPGLIGGLTHSEKAVRPIPSDGLPACGFVEPGLYSVVSHSGITLAPILGALAAAEITHRVRVDMLHPFRPARFFTVSKSYGRNSSQESP